MEARRRENDKFRLLAAKKKSTENSIPSKTILPIRKRNFQYTKAEAVHC